MSRRPSFNQTGVQVRLLWTGCVAFWGAVLMCIILIWVQSYYSDTLSCFGNRATGEEWCIYRGGVYLRAHSWSPRPPPQFEVSMMAVEIFVPQSLTINLWVVLFFATLIPLLAKLSIEANTRRVRARRRRNGFCERCSYDLRGLASSRCPECGLEKVGRPAVVAIDRQS